MSLKCAQNRGETTCTDTTSLKVCIFLLIDLISIMWLDESKVDSSMFGSFACLPFLSLSSKVRLTRVEEWISLDWLDEENVWYHKHQGKQQDKQTHLFFPSQTKRLTKRHPNVPFITSAFFFFAYGHHLWYLHTAVRSLRSDARLLWWDPILFRFHSHATKGLRSQRWRRKQYYNIKYMIKLLLICLNF